LAGAAAEARQAQHGDVVEAVADGHRLAGRDPEPAADPGERLGLADGPAA
jgi:hypothetical protein